MSAVDAAATRSPAPGPVPGVAKVERGAVRSVLVVGCPRSGTTLMQSIIAAHPEVFSSPETHFFADSVGQRSERMFRMPALSWRERRSRVAHRCRVAMDLTQWRACRRRLIEFLADSDRPDLMAQVPARPFMLDPAARLYVSLGERVARDSGRTVWLEKTPDHLHYLDTVDRFMPEAKVVCVIRSGPDNIASLYDVARKYPDRWHPRYGTLDGCINRWLCSARDAMRQAGRPGRLFVSYESLASDPAKVAEAVCRFIGLDYRPGMVEARGDVFDQIVRHREPHKKNIQEKIAPRNGTKFQQLFTPEQRAHIHARLGDWPQRLQELCDH
ncbi:sulfotransferase family protein [Frateuria soli]|uniref:sulfotransferase family protein n=1 Tax=Frateuria soli TaxID=1542730 RepID=UPI001E5129F3|nr:sulfotransferase [Frateuria soli]UGB38527.1 sulfotransferase [Frateuria soli]